MPRINSIRLVWSGRHRELSVGSLRDAGGTLLDCKLDLRMAIEGERVAELHPWRLKLGCLGAVVSVARLDVALVVSALLATVVAILH